jgi:hypothetical protein
MGMLMRFSDGEKAKHKINACREAGLKVFENFITGVTTVEYDSSVVLRCSRQGSSRWKMEYNEDFWEEIDAQEPAQENAQSA